MTTYTCKATILVCTYNGEASLADALSSARAQAGSVPFEILVVDDGSTDGTTAVVERIAKRDQRVRLLRQPENRGLPAACNAGIAAAAGEYILRLDDDDRLSPEALLAMCPFLDGDEADWVYSDRIDRNTATGDEVYVSMHPFSIFRLIACGVLMRKSLIVEAGGYRRLFWEEYDLFFRYMQKAERPSRHVARPLYVYSRRSGSMTADPDQVRHGWEELEAIWGKDTLMRYGWNPEGTFDES